MCPRFAMVNFERSFNPYLTVISKPLNILIIYYLLIISVCHDMSTGYKKVKFFFSFKKNYYGFAK